VPRAAGSGGLALSADGRFVAFTSDATNLVAGDTNGRADVFVHCAGGTPPPAPAACPAGPPTLASLGAEVSALATLRARLATRRAATLIGADVRTQLEAAVDQARADAKKLRATFTAAGSGA
jgi:hypothetical protein